MGTLLEAVKGWTEPIIVMLGAVLAILITAGYLVAICQAIKTAGVPPLVADPVSTSAGVQQLGPQLRGAVNQHENLMATIAVISPLATTIIGFYFGTRAGAAGQQAQNSQKRVATTNAILDSAHLGDADTKQNLIDELRRKNLL